MTTTSTARKRVQQARANLLLDSPFFGVLALKLHIVEDDTCETAWTDGTSMGYSPKFVDTLTNDELLGVIAHEVMHCATGHPWRRDARDPERFNIAADYAINYVIADAGFKLPTPHLRDAQYDGKSAEWIYARLPQQQQQQQQQQGSGSGQGGGSGQGKGKSKGAGPSGASKRPGNGGQDVRDAPNGKGQTDDATSEADWQQAVQQAAVAAKQAGKLPASLDRFAKAATRPRVDWKSVLRRFVQQCARADYSWQRPNTRYLARGFYLPSLHSETMGPIAVVVDTSGSIDDTTLAIFSAEINSIHGEMRPACTHVIYADAKVHRTDTFTADDVVELKPVGGGGTAFAPALDAAEKLDDAPVALIYLTDLAGTHRPEPPDFPVLWASIGNQSAPWGEVVSLHDV